MSKKWLILVMTLIVLLMTMPLLAACDDDDDEEETEVVQPTKMVEPTETVQATDTVAPTEPVDECAKKEKFLIGQLTTVAGQAAEARDVGIDIAIEEINEAGGLIVGDTCYELDLTWEDEGLTTSGTVAGIIRLLYESKADVIFHNGWIGSLPIQAHIQDAEIPLFTWTGPSNVLLSHGNDWSFLWNTDSAAVTPLVLDWISENRPDIKTLGSVQADTTQARNSMDALGKYALTEYGIEFKGAEWVEFMTRDYYPALTAALKGEHPDALLVPMSSPGLVKQARELGFEGTFILSSSMPTYWYLMHEPEELDGIISLSATGKDITDSPMVSQIYKDYLENYVGRKDVMPYAYNVFNTYIFPYYIAEVLKAAGSTDPEKLREVIETQMLTVTFPSGETMDIKMSGAETFGMNHIWSPPLYLSVHNNDVPQVMTVITPEEQAEYAALYMRYYNQ